MYIPFASMRARRIAACALTLLTCGTGLALEPARVSRFRLENGLRVLVLDVEGAEHVGIFSFLPLGLAGDAAGRTQWSHLIEHLTLRTTGPIEDYHIVNGETSAEGMHLDFVDTAAAWKRGLGLQSKWLSGLDFSEESLAEEVPKALAEVDSTLRGLYTHKWAIAAWNQVFRHGAESVSIREPLRTARLADAQVYRDRHLVDLDRTLLCIIGDTTEAELRRELDERFGKIRSRSAKEAPKKRKLPEPGLRRAPWDLPVTHIVDAYPAPEVAHEDFAALYVLSSLLGMALFQDADLKGRVGAAIGSLDLVTPEGRWLQLSASVQPGAAVEDVRKGLRRAVDTCLENPALAIQLPFLLQQLAAQLTDPPDFAQLMSRLPPGLGERQVLGNLGLQQGLLEYRLGEHREAVAKRIGKLRLEDLKRVRDECLAPARNRGLTLTPADESSE